MPEDEVRLAVNDVEYVYGEDPPNNITVLVVLASTPAITTASDTPKVPAADWDRAKL